MTSHAEGVVVSVRAQPRAKRNGFAGVCNRQMKLAVTAPPENGKANDALVEVIAESLGVRRSQVRLFSGASSRSKKFLIQGVAIADIERRVATLLAEM